MAARRSTLENIMFDPVAVQNIRDAIGYSDLCNKAEQAEAYSAEQERKLNAVLNGIRKANLTPAVVEMILNTLANRMAACGFSDSDVEAVDSVSQVIA